MFLPYLNLLLELSCIREEKIFPLPFKFLPAGIKNSIDMQGYQAKIKELFKNIYTSERPYKTNWQNGQNPHLNTTVS